MGYSFPSTLRGILCKHNKVRILPHSCDPLAIKVLLELSAKNYHRIMCDIIRFQTICCLAGMKGIFTPQFILISPGIFTEAF